MLEYSRMMLLSTSRLLVAADAESHIGIILPEPSSLVDREEIFGFDN